MDLQRPLQRILRIICAYAAVGMILLICLCVGLWSAFETSLRVTNEAFQNIFQRRRNVPFIESDDETSKDELQTFPKSTNPPSDDTTSECTSSPTFSGPTRTVNTSEEKATDKQTKNDRISTKEDFSNLEGLALQMVHLEQHRLSTDEPFRPSDSEICVRSPQESVPVNVIAPKSVLKSFCSENKPSTSTRGTRRIRFQDPPIHEVSKGSSDDFTSPKKPLKGSPLGPQQRKILPAAYLKSGLNFQESPVKSSGTKIHITEQSSEALPTEKALMINLSSGISSNQQLANAEKKSLAEESNSTIPTAFSSETTNNEKIANKSMDPLSEEFNSTNLTELSSETANSKHLAKESVDSLSNELNPTNPLMLSTNIATNQQVSNKSMDSLSEESNSTNSTPLSSESATHHQVTNESMDSTVPTAYKELEESPKVGDRGFEPEKEESTSELKSDERRFLEETSEEISNEAKEMKVELIYESSVKEKASSSNEKEESLKKRDTEDIREFPDKSEAESLIAMNLLSESSISQQSTEELINANLGESTSSEELNQNQTFLKTDEELCKSIESDLKSKLKLMESTAIADHKEASQEIIVQTLNKMDVEKLSDDSSEREGMGHRPMKKKHTKKCKKGH